MVARFRIFCQLSAKTLHRSNADWHVVKRTLSAKGVFTCGKKHWCHRMMKRC